MSTSAIVLMVVAAVLLFGGLAVSIAVAVRSTRRASAADGGVPEPFRGRRDT